MKLHYFFGLHSRSRFVGGLARDRSSTRGGGGGGSHFSGAGARFAGTHFTARSGNRFIAISTTQMGVSLFSGAG